MANLFPVVPEDSPGPVDDNNVEAGTFWRTMKAAVDVEEICNDNSDLHGSTEPEEENLCCQQPTKMCFADTFHLPAIHWVTDCSCLP